MDPLPLLSVLTEERIICMTEALATFLIAKCG